MTQPSGPPDPIPMRIGTAERTSALEALGEHLSAGRLDIDEYGERSARVTVARTTADLAALFTDLPLPHPTMPGRSAPAIRPASSPAATTDSRVVPRPDTRTAGQRWAAAAVPLAVIAAVGLYFLAHVWFVFLLIPVVAVIAGAISGPDNNHRDRRRRELGP